MYSFLKYQSPFLRPHFHFVNKARNKQSLIFHKGKQIIKCQRAGNLNILKLKGTNIPSKDRETDSTFVIGNKIEGSILILTIYVKPSLDVYIRK